jgi:phospholipase D1/2
MTFPVDWARFGENERGLMAYPILVGEEGEITGMTSQFPDTKAKVVGSKSNVLSPILTT